MRGAGNQNSGLLFGARKTESPKPKLSPSEKEAIELAKELEEWTARGGVVKRVFNWTSWTLNGQKHREGSKPAMECDNGDKEWYENNELHRVDGPAVINAKGKEWHQRGLFHRDDGPAVDYVDGTQLWYQHQKPHRDGDEPALVYANGTKTWCKNGMYHREGDKPAVEHPDGGKEWYKHNKPHRDNDLPAVVLGEFQAWLVDGQKHRENGPAIIHVDGKQEFWIRGVRQS